MYNRCVSIRLNSHRSSYKQNIQKSLFASRINLRHQDIMKTKLFTGQKVNNDTDRELEGEQVKGNQ